MPPQDPYQQNNVPPQQNAPQQPVPPQPNAVPPFNPDNFAPATPPKSNKKLIVGIIITVVVTTLLVIVAAVIIILSNRNSHPDEHPAEEQQQSSNVEVPYPESKTASSGFDGKFNQTISNDCYTVNVFDSMLIKQEGCGFSTRSGEYDLFVIRARLLSNTPATAAETAKALSTPPDDEESKFKLISEEAFTLDGYNAVKQVYSNDNIGTEKVSVISESPEFISEDGTKTHIVLIDGAYYHTAGTQENFDETIKTWNWR